MAKHNTINGLNYDDIDWHHTECLICSRSKLKQFKVPNKALRDTGRPFSTGSIDLYGPIAVPSLSGYRYGLMFIDNHSSYGMVEFLKSKKIEELVDAITKWKLTITNLGFELNIIQADSDTIFEDIKFNNALRSLNIECQYAPPGAHQLNGLVERMIQTIAAMSRAMLIASGLPLKYWTYAMNYAMLIYNSTLKTRFKDNEKRKYTSPYEAILGNKPIFNFPIFGCIMVSKHPNSNLLPALENRGRTSAFLGFDSQHHNCYIGLHLKTSHIIYSKDVVIYEHYYAYTFEPTDYFQLGYPIDFEARKSREEILDELGELSSDESDSESESETNSIINEESEEEIENESSNTIFNEQPFTETVNMDINNDLDNNTNQLRRTSRPHQPKRYFSELIKHQLMNKINISDKIKFKYNNNHHIDSIIKIKTPITYPYPKSKIQIDSNSGSQPEPEILKNHPQFDQISNIKPKVRNINQPVSVDTIIYRIATLFKDDLDEDTELALSKRNLKRLKDGYDVGYEDNEIISYMLGVKNTILDGKFEEVPQNFAEAMSDKFKDKYYQSILDELKSHFTNGSFYERIYNEEELPIGTKPIDSKWVHTAKVNENGNLMRYKSRLVLRGFKQIYGDSYFETYSPTASQDSIRSIIAHAAIYGMKLFHWDFKTAYLNSPLNEILFVELFDGFTLNDIYKTYFNIHGLEDDIEEQYIKFIRRYKRSNRKLYLRARKAIYGTKQGSKAWYDTITKILLDAHYENVTTDKCLFHKRDGNNFIIFIIYVDDIEGTTNSEQMFNDLWTLISDQFNLVDLGESNQILGCNVTRDTVTGNILLSNSNYIDKLLKVYNMENCKYKGIPGKANRYFNYHDCPKPEDVNTELRNKYRMLIGSLLFMANYWRPDIMFMVSHLARFAHIPSQQHMDGALLILNYLAYTKHLGLIYYRNININQQNINPIMITYADSNFAGDIDAVSTAGMFIQLIDQSDIEDITKIRPFGNIISYFSKRQPQVAESTALAEYIGLWMASNRIFTVAESLKQIGFKQLNNGIPVYCDSSATIDSVYNDTKLGRINKHMATKYHSLREAVIKQEINLMHVPTEFNISDMLTKPLSRTIFRKFRDQVMGGASATNAEVVSTKKRKIKHDEL